VILVLAGTRDGRELAADLARQGWPVSIAVVSDYGRKLAAQDGLTVHTGCRDTAGLVALLRTEGVRAVVDASHPYAAAVSRNVQEACAALGLPYLRYERPPAPLPEYDKLYRAADAATAARLAAGLGKVVFLATGSRTLAVFKNEPLLAGHRLIARVLPEPEVLAVCRRLGFAPGDIVALQGPFSHQLNAALFREYAADVIVTKNSGLVGGTDSKLSAARELGLPVVVIDRPAAEYSRVAADFGAVGDFIREVME
jgi:precorrin-6A/cobalt-precorrin-6A reductase